MTAIGAILGVLALQPPDTLATKAIDMIGYIAGGGAIYRYFADRGKSLTSDETRPRKDG